MMITAAVKRFATEFQSLLILLSCTVAQIYCLSHSLSVCEYYAHLDCQDFVVSDCMECATYFPQTERVLLHYNFTCYHIVIILRAFLSPAIDQCMPVIYDLQTYFFSLAQVH